MTEEEKKKQEDDFKSKKADWMKKNKKKPKTDEEEKKDYEDLKIKIAEKLSKTLMESGLEAAEKEINIIKTKYMMSHHKIMNEDAYEELHRRKSVRDVEISNKDLLIRMDLDIPLSPYEPPPPSNIN